MSSAISALPPQRIGIRSLRDVAAVVMRHLGKSAAVFVVVSALATAAMVYWPEIYLSEAKLLVKISGQVEPLEITGRTTGVPRSRESEIQSELAILESQDLLRGVVEKLGPEPFLGTKARDPQSRLSPAEAALLQLEKNMRASGEQESNIIRLVYSNESPDVARQVLETLIALFLEKRVLVHRSPGAYEFLSEQLSGLDERLRGLRERLYTIKAEDDIYALDEQRRSVGQLVASREEAAAELAASIAAAVSRIESLQQEYERLPATRVLSETSGWENGFSDHMRQRLYDMKMQLRELSSKYQPDNLTIKDLKERIAITEGLLEKEDTQRTHVTTGPDENRHQIQLSIVNEQAALLGLKSRLATALTAADVARKRLDDLNKREKELSGIERDIQLSEQTRTRWFEGVEQARIDKALEEQKISNITMVQAATRPTLPVGPGRKWILMVGIAVAAFAAIGTVFLFDYFDDSFHTPEAVEAGLRLPVLASIPASGRLGRALARAHDRNRPWDGSLPKEVARECRLMVARVTSKLGADRRPLVLGVTSSKAGVGATSVAAVLAAELAKRGDGPVLLVDRDLNSQRLTRTLVGESEAGTGDAAPPLRATLLENLHILPAGAESAGLREVVEKHSFAYVVVDVPAVELAEHALTDARKCDGVVFVVAPGKSHWLEAHRGIDILKDGGVRVIGTVLNNRRSRNPD
ncbi:MAG TPA: hypothetical protein VF384_15915 [Planctomycetota bacterium]